MVYSYRIPTLYMLFGFGEFRDDLGLYGQQRFERRNVVVLRACRFRGHHIGPIGLAGSRKCLFAKPLEDGSLRLPT